MNSTILKNKALLALIIAVVITIAGTIAVLSARANNKWRDTVYYEGETYVTLQYNMDIFTYLFNANAYYDEETVQPVPHDKWKIVYFGGDLFVLEKQIKEAEKYYANDDNYKWFVAFDEDDTVRRVPLPISDDELEYLYDMESIPRSETMTFDEIKQFADIVKISNDGLVYAVISLAQYKDSWYWKTEIIDDSRDDNAEYVIKLPDSLSEKIFALSEQ